MLFFMIYPFGMSMKMIQRFLFYTMPFFIISIEIIFRDIKLLSMSFQKRMLFMIFFFWGMIKYIGNHPAYSYRSLYNIQKSPYDAN